MRLSSAYGVPVSTDEQAAPQETTPARMLLPLVVPALVVGVACSLLFLGVSELAEKLQHVLWTDLPDALGVGGYSSLWMIVMLTATGILVGLVVWKAPGHAGPDPATVGLASAPLPPFLLPGLLVATALMLAGGPSLGPENPIIAANIALVFWLGAKARPAVPPRCGSRWPRRRRSARCSARPSAPPSSSPRPSRAGRSRARCGTPCSRHSPRPPPAR